MEDYRDGYQQGFEIGYNTGFEKRSFDATIPPDLRKRGLLTVKTTTDTTVTTPIATTTTPTETVDNSTVVTTQAETTDNQQVSDNTQPVTTTNSSDSTMNTTVTSNRTENTINTPVYDTQSVVIPTDTEIIIELLDDLNTDRNSEGDKFTAKIISPYELSGAIIEGRVSKIQKPGRIKRRSQMLLSFDRIVMMENRWSNFNAILTEVLPTKGDNVKMVDTEGTAVGKSSLQRRFNQSRRDDRNGFGHRRNRRRTCRSGSRRRRRRGFRRRSGCHGARKTHPSQQKPTASHQNRLRNTNQVIIKHLSFTIYHWIYLINGK